jgi:hypothetical protein
MALTYQAIATATIGSGGASTFSFTSIPQTYTDLLIKFSGRSTNAGAYDDLIIKPNNSTSSINTLVFYGLGSGTPASTTFVTGLPAQGGGDTLPANTFGNADIYIFDYTSSNSKNIMANSIAANNVASSIQQFGVMLWSVSSAITSLYFANFSGSNFKEFTTAYLYGIKNS